MTNKQISAKFSLLNKLMDLHNENAFKSKSYASASFKIRQLQEPLSEMTQKEISSIPGIGVAISQKIIELLESGSFKLLDELLNKTPEGILEMLQIKGLGAKKIATIWKEMEIEDIGELLHAIDENRLLRFEGFGKKTQDNIRQAIEFYQKQKGHFLFRQVDEFSKDFYKILLQHLSTKLVSISGDMRRHSETISFIDYVVALDKNEIIKQLTKIAGLKIIAEEDQKIEYETAEGIKVNVHASDENNFGNHLFTTSGSQIFVNQFNHQYPDLLNTAYSSEEEIFKSVNMQFIPAFLRESESVIEVAQEYKIPRVIEPKDIKGLIHCHSVWSDGIATIEEMAKGCIERGLEYMVISDHSKAAFYAQGLTEERIIAQHLEIDKLNKKLAPFKIFKSIECDILSNGDLDYNNEILSSFDLVIASVHSNLKMNEQKAMHRLMKAIENPFTTILGHMTGRLLLSRDGYPVDHEKIIDACAKNKVVIEINANPRRLDMRWQWIPYALGKGVMLSIDPDAHSVAEIDNNKYGVYAAQKAMLISAQNLSSFSLFEFEKYLAGLPKRG